MELSAADLDSTDLHPEWLPTDILSIRAIEVEGDDPDEEGHVIWLFDPEGKPEPPAPKQGAPEEILELNETHYTILSAKEVENTMTPQIVRCPHPSINVDQNGRSNFPQMDQNAPGSPKKISQFAKTRLQFIIPGLNDKQLPKDLEKLAKYCRIRKVQPGEKIMSESDENPFLLVACESAMIKLEDETYLGMEPGGATGWIAFIEGGRRTTSGTLIGGEPVHFLEIDPAGIEQLSPQAQSFIISTYMGAAKDMLADLNKKHDGPPPVLESFVQLPGDPKNPKQYRILKTAEELDPIKPGTQISIPPNTLLMFTGEIDIRNPETHEVVATIKAEKSGMVGEAIAFSTLLSGNIYARSEVRCAIINRELDSDLANPEEQLALDRLIAAEFTKKLRQAIAARHAHKAAREAALQN